MSSIQRSTASMNLDDVCKELAQMREYIEFLKRCYTQRGARMQILRRYLPDDQWALLVSQADADGWFDEDGAPI